MNKIYKVVWSRARQCYVVVSEYAKRQTKSASTKKLLAAFFAAGIVLGAGGLAQANHMMDGSIVAGSDNSSKGIDTFVSGTGNTVIGTDNLVSGYKNTLKEYKSAANGYVSGATKKETSYSLVAGSENSLAGHYGAVHGSQNTVTGTYSTAWGASNTINNMMQIKHITVSGQEVFDEGKDDGLMATVWGNDNVIKADGKSSTLVVSDGGTGTGDWGGKLATVWGDHNTVQGLASTVWGSGNTVGALARYSTVWGSGNEVGEGVFHATVWGAENVVSGKIMYATVFGTKNKADTQANAALVSGKANTVSGDSSSVLGGVYNTVSGDSSSVLGGVYNTVSGENSLAGGSGSVADGDSAFALGTSEAALAAKEEAKSGKGAMAKGDGAIALDGSATGKGAIAIGMGAASNMDHGIALGKGSLTTRNAGDHNAYGKGTSDTGAAWIATDAALAIGNDTAGSLVTRQITGVAAGSADTDAVNVAQLENIADKVKTITVNSDGVKNLTLTATDDNYNIDLAKNIDLGEKGSLSIGRDNKISNNGYLAVGLKNEASGAYSSITGGLNNVASGQYSTVTGGEGGKATGLLASVIGGKGSTAAGEGSVAWGDHTEANGKYSTAFGMSYNDSTLGGYIKTRANGEGSVSFGIGSQALGRYSVAWGMGTKTYGATSTVSGLYNVNYSMLGNVWGYSNNVSGDGVKTGDEQEQPWQIEGVTAFGKENKVYGTDATIAAYSTVWGSNNEVSGSRATAWGQNNKVSAARATVFGYYNQALGENSLAGGRGSVADGDSAFALGTSEAALAAKGEAQKGQGALAKGDGAIALDGSATGKGAIAIGMGAVSNMDHGIALGKGSLTTRKGGDLNAYGKGTSDTGAAWIATDAALAIGNDTAGSLVTRQITGVAAGSADTDAVNVAQLKRKADADAGNLTPANVTAWQTKLGTGTVSAGTEGSGLVTGVTMYNELRTQDGNYIKASNTTSQNLTALDQKVASHDTTINDLRNNSYMNYKADGTDVIKKNLTETLAIKSEKDSGITSTVKTEGTDQYIEIGLDANKITFGKDGQDGKDGEIHIVNKDGTTTIIRYDGKDGAPGVDGKPGEDGRIVYGKETVATLNDGLKFKGDGTEVIAKKLNETLDITGGTGITSTVKAKADGSQYLEIAFDASDIDGSDITFGKDGKDGKDGEIKIVHDGTTTVIKIDGKDGKPGVDGKNGEDGRIVYGKETVATLNDGLKFGGDSGEAIAKKLNEQLDIKGGADTANLTDGNIGVVSDGSQLNVKLAKDVKDLNSVTANNMYVTNVGDESTSVVNKSYLTQEINKVDAKHTTVTTDDNLTLEVTDATDTKGANYKLGLGDKITVGGVTVGKSETQNADGSTTIHQQVTGLTNKTWDGKTIVSGRAATEDQLQSAVKEAKDAVTDAGFGLTDGTKTVTKKLGEAIKVTGTNGITTEVKGDGDEKYMEVSIGNNITIGKDGKDGEDGSITIINKDGTSAVIGIDGKDGENGKPGVDGKDGITRIVYDENKIVATLDDGLVFGGDSGDAIAKKLNEQLDIKGGVTDTANLTDGNIGVVSDGEKLNVKLAKDLKNLGSIATEDGITIGKQTFKVGDLNTDAINAVTGLENKTWDGKNIVSGRAATEDQLSQAITEAGDAITTKGFGLSDGTKTVTKKLGETIKVTGADGITTEVVEKEGEKQLEISLGDELVIGGKDGKDGKDGSITIINKDGTSAVIGIDGKDGENGKPGVDGKDGITRIVYDENKIVATLDDGLVFGGDSGDAIAKKLNEQLDIKGGVTDTANLTDGNIGVVSDGEKLNVKLAKDLKNLGSIATEDGITIGKQTFKVGDLNTDAINAVTGLENKTWDGKNIVSGRAATEDQLQSAVKEAKDAVTEAGFGLTDGTKTVTKKLGEAVKVTGTNGITTEVKGDGDEQYMEVSIGNNITIGKDGKDGEDGSITIINKDGTTTVIKVDGKDGENGKPGVDGAPGVDGKPGVNGKDGITRIVYDENTIVATLDDGIIFAGDTGEESRIKLDEILNVKGGVTDTAALTDGNIGVVANGAEGLSVKLAKDLTDIHSIKMKKTDGTAGVVVGEQEISTGGSSIERGDYVTGLDNTSWDENHTVVEDRAATEGQLADVIEQVNGNADSKTFGLSSLGSDGSVTGTATQTVDHAIKVKGANGITVAASGTGDDAALEISLGNNITVGKDGKDGAEGSIGIAGHDGKDGISTTTIKTQFISGNDGTNGINGLDGINGRDGVPGLNGKDGITRIVYETPEGTTEEVATLKDGLFFAGDSGDKIAKTLNTKLDIVGGATAELTDGNIGVVSDGEKLNVKLSSKVTGLTSVTSENMYVTNVDEKNNNSVTNVEYVNKTVADSAWKLTTNGGKDDVAAEEISQNDTVDFSAENGVKISREGANVKVGLSDSITVGDIQIGARTSTGEDGSDKTDYYVTGLTNKDWDGNSIVSGRAATEDQLKAATEQMGDELADTEFGLSDDAGNTVTRKVNGAVPVKGDGSIKTTVATDADGNQYLEVGLTNKLTVGEAAKDGVGGADGSVTIVKQDGTKGEITVVNGKDGVNGTAGLPGTDGKDGITRIEYKDAAGVKHDVATLEDGLAFKGDGETVISKKLNETLEIKGGAKADNLSDNNIGVVANEDGSLSVKLAKDVAGLTSVSAGNMYVTNVDGNKDDSVTNVEYVKNAVAGSAWKLTVNADTDAKETAKDVKQGTQVDFTGENGIIVSKEVVESDTEDAAKVKISLGNNITVGKDGADGKTGTITIYGKDGRDGKDGISPTVIGTEYVAKDGAKGEQGIPGLDGKDGADGTTRIVYTDVDGTKHDVATLDDGFYFAGNSGDVVGKKLNTKLTIKGDGTKDDSAYSAENIKTKTTETGDLLIMMDKDLKADSYTAGKTDGDKTVITKDGITIEAAKAENNVIVTETKISAGNNKIENVADGSISEGSKDAVNGGQLFEEIKKTTEADKRLVSGAGKGQLGTYDTVTDENKVNLRVEDANGNGEDIVITNVAKASDLGDINDIHDSLKTKDDNGNAKKTDVVTVINNLDTKLTETIDTGMTFAGNSGDVSKKLGETVSIKGEGTKADSEYDGQNIKTIVDADGNLLIKMDKNLTADSYTAGGTVVNGDGITIAATTGTDGKDPITIIQDKVSFGSNIIHNVADGKERSDAATVGQLEDAITDAKNADKHIRTGTYAVGGQGVANGVSIDVISNENGKETVAGQVVITDMAKASEVGDVSGINKDLWNKVVDEKGNPTTDDEGHSITKPTVVDAINNLNGKVDAVDAKVGDLDYSKVEGTKIEDGDSTTTAIGKLDNRMDAMDSKIDDVSKSHTEVTAGNGIIVTDNGDKDADGNITKHKYEVALNPEITLGDKTNDGKLTVTGKDGNAVTVDGADGSVTAGDVVINKGGEGTISGLKNLDWDASKVDTAAADGGYKGSSKAATESQLQQAMAGAIQYDRKSDGSVDTTKVTLADNSGAGTTITNVADGKVEKGSKDAVNGGQLYETQQAIISNSQTIQNIGGAVNKLGTRIDRVGAGAAALAALHPLDFDPDAKWDFAAGYGNFRGANAAAIGAYYRPNEDVMVSIAGSMGGGENMVNAGVSVKLGAGHSNVSTSKTAMAKEIKEMRGIVAEQDAQIAKLTEIVNALVGVRNALPYNPDGMFPDVPENHWAYEAVDDMIARGLVEGYPDGTFGGDRSLTRYEFAMIVHRALLKGAEVSERLQQEFADELKYFTVDVVERDKDGVATIQRVRTVRERVNDEVR